MRRERGGRRLAVRPRHGNPSPRRHTPGIFGLADDLAACLPGARVKRASLGNTRRDDAGIEVAFDFFDIEYHGYASPFELPRRGPGALIGSTCIC